MAGQTPRNWQIDLPHARMQAVASRASAMSIIREKTSGDPRDPHAALVDLSISLRSETRGDHRTCDRDEKRRRDVRRRVAVGRRRMPSLGINDAEYFSFFSSVVLHKQITNSSLRYVYKIFRNPRFATRRSFRSRSIMARSSYGLTEFEKFSRRSDTRCDL